MQGLHLICDAADCACDLNLLTSTKQLQQLCLDAVAGAGLNQVNHLFHKFSADFTSGITGVVLLAESHLAVHTWPELKSVTLDVYVCNYGCDNNAKAQALMHSLVTAFKAKTVKHQAINRGSSVPTILGEGTSA